MSMPISQRVATASVAGQNINDDAPVKEDFKIRVVEPEPFDSVLMIKCATTYELSNMVNSLFLPNMHDYYGCVVRPAESFNNAKMGIKPMVPTTNNPNVVLTVYFTDKGQPPENGQSVKCLKPISSGQQSLIERVNRLNNIMHNRNYALTDEAKSMLMEFVEDAYQRPTKSGKRVPNWSQIMTEVPDQTSQGVRACVSIQLDILKVLKEVYKTNVGNHRYDYAIMVARPANHMPQFGLSTEYMYQIYRYDMGAGHKILQQIGINDNGSSLNIIRA